MVRALHTRWAIDRNDAQKKTPTRLAGRIEPKSKDITRAHIATTIHKSPFFFEWRSRSSLNMSKGKWSRFLPVSLTPEYRRRRCNGRDTKPIMTSQFTAVKCTNWKPQQAFLLHDIMKEEEQTCDVNSQAQLRQISLGICMAPHPWGNGECQVYLLLLIYWSSKASPAPRSKVHKPKL